MKVSLRKKKLSNGNFSLYLDFYFRGERKYEFLELRLINDKETDKETWMMAQAIQANRLLELQRKQHNFKPPEKQGANFIEFFKKLKEERPNDRSTWYCTLRKLEQFSNEHLLFFDIDEEWLKRFQQYLLSEVAGITAFHYYANVRQALRKAVKDKIISESPAENIPGLKKPETKREYLTLSEIKKLIRTKCNNSEVKDAFLFSCFTGLRYSDVKNLKWSNIRENKIEFRQQKTGSLEYLPLAESAKNLLNKKGFKAKKNSDDCIFNMPSKAQIHHHIKKWVTTAKINKKISYHNSRHSFGTLALTSGIDIYTVSKLMTHKDLTTTQAYAKIIDQKKRTEINKLPAIKF